jgi:hypothetical protein
VGGSRIINRKLLGLKYLKLKANSVSWKVVYIDKAVEAIKTHR